MDEDAVAMNLCFLLALIVASRGTPAVGQALAMPCVRGLIHAA